MKKKMISVFIYWINLLLLFIPWIVIGGHKYNIFQFAYKVLTSGLTWLADLWGFAANDFLVYQVGIYIELIAFGMYILSSVIYVVSRIAEKRWKLNIVNIFFVIVITILTYGGYSLHTFCEDPLMAYFIVFVMSMLTLVEIPISLIMDRWDETVKEVKEYQEKADAWEKEVKERLQFDGKFTYLFYRIVWKNFKSNWKDYILLLFCNTIIFGFVVTGLGLQRILEVENTNEGIGIFTGLGSILANAMVPMGIISIFIIILMIFYYLKCRARSYGVFLNLGMRRKSLYYFIALEFVSSLIVSMILGAFLGTGILLWFTSNSLKLLGVHIGFASVGILPYLKAMGIILGISIVSMAAAREIFIDFNVGKSTDLRAIQEKMPGRFRRIFIGIGTVILLFCMLRYGQRNNFENVSLLLGFFVGYILVFRFAMADSLIREREDKNYIKKLLLHNQLFHKSRTNTGYIVVITIINFCVLFYFSFQLISTLIAEDADKLYPYDVVCLASEEDTDYFKELSEKYEVEMYEYPAFRISAYDCTEELDNGRELQGQHIGISESTYHKLKKYLDADYQATDLGLDEDGENVYVVYQQDKSIKAQPIAYYPPRSKPILHFGQPCRLFEPYDVGRGIDNIEYRYYKVCGEEVGSLTGVFRQGLRENIIVFSDEHFETAKTRWEKTDIYTGRMYEPEEHAENGVVINQGITKLILMNVAETDIRKVQDTLEEYEEMKLEEERNLYSRYYFAQGVYDYSVSYHYMKQEAVKNLETERIMKITMNTLVIFLFFFMNIMLITIKMLSEKEQNEKRAEFLNCMGMRRKERIKFLKKELMCYYGSLPMIIAILFAGIFVVLVFRIRMYTLIDIKSYYTNMGIFWGSYTVLNTLILWLISTIYAHKIEK